MKICFLARPSFDKFTVGIYKDLKERYCKDLQGFFVTSNKKESSYVRENISEAIVCETSAYIKEHWEECTLNKLVEFEEKYDCAPIWKYIYTDRFLINADYEYAIRITTGLFMFFENIFENNNVDIYYSECIATLQCYIAYLVGRKHGVRYLSQMLAREKDLTHHYFLDDPYQGNMNFNKEFLNVEYTKEEYEYADMFLSEFESKEISPQSMSLVEKLPKLRWKYVLLLPYRLIKQFDPKYTDPYSYMYYKAYQRAFDPIKFYFRYQKSKKHYTKPDYSKKYVYYPLHYQPEASTIVCAQKYEKQLYYIDSWAKSLPADTVLYVKEHHALIGHRDISFYRELKKYPNVFLIDPLESSRKLIESAQAVTTLTGTAGWEAMLLRKPVFIAGNIFFDDAPGVIKVDDIMGQYLPNILKWEKPQRDTLLKYLCQYFRTLSVGNVYPRSPKYCEKSNIMNIVDALVKQLRKMGII